MIKYFFRHSNLTTKSQDPNCKYCVRRVTNRSPNPDRIGYGPNKPNTINL